MAHATQMSSADTGLLVIDVQEKLIGKIINAEAVVRNIGFLLDVARLLNLPVQCTEQYPQGLGPTVPQLAAKLPQRAAKQAFSCCGVPTVVQSFHREARPKLLLCGIETHVCVLHSALDLLALDFRIYVAVDAVGSRDRIDHDVALRRLEKAGVVLTTTEMCVFEWMGGSGHPQFKAISRLIQERMKTMTGTP